MYSYDEALNIILNKAQPLPLEIHTVEDALDCILAADITANINVPPFANSAMDGYAFRALDIADASLANPIKLPIQQSIAAGAEHSPHALKGGTAAEIMTGAPTPAGADTVIPVERTQRDESFLIFTEPYPTGCNIRSAGEDMKIGQRIARAGHRITAALVPALCSLGRGTVPVTPRPKIVWLSTGQELVDDFSAPLGPSQIYNSSGPFGESMAAPLGADLLWRRTVADDGTGFQTALNEAMKGPADVIISTGAVSVGKYDFVRSELTKLGAEIFLHRAKVKPGKPILFARLSNGKYFFGLPGNPVSTAMGLRMFVSPFLRALSGQATEKPIKARLTNPIQASKRLTCFLKGRVECSDTGTLVVHCLQGQESFKVAPMVQMNCWIKHPEGLEVLAEGSLVDCIPFFPLNS
ncbi:molybdopterin molybdotransferase MoeA [Kordiimonas sediminis]|uniref:molybdopterin molybdotransferase MoeA n=1 Tax=Kordiimonas sediminis TaxID=1735581 RepID=UPI00174CC5C5|nr:gephyrin-like molybdotransferase Glp [Kordiimonas sediminis]